VISLQHRLHFSLFLKGPGAKEDRELFMEGVSPLAEQIAELKAASPQPQGTRAFT